MSHYSLARLCTLHFALCTFFLHFPPPHRIIGITIMRPWRNGRRATLRGMRRSACLPSFSLTVFRLAHKCRTTALRAFALCTLHSALLKQESCPKGSPLKAVSHQPSAVSRQPSAGDLAERASPVFQSDSLSSRAHMSHYSLARLCTLHFALCTFKTGLVAVGDT